jgi:hypothetical protein
MTPASFRLFDFLNCCYVAVCAADSGRAAAADEAWLEAWTAMDLLGAPAGAGEIHAAASPARRGNRAAFTNALDAAVRTVLYALDGPGDAGCRLRDALAAAALTEQRLGDALTVLLTGSPREVTA